MPKRSLSVDTLASKQEAKRVLGNAVVSQVVFQPKWRKSQGGQVAWTKQLPPAWLDGWQSDFWPRKKSIPSALAWVQVALWKLGRIRDNLRDLQALGVRTPLEKDYALIRKALVEDAALLKRILGLQVELSPESASPEAYLDALHDALLGNEETREKQRKQRKASAWTAKQQLILAALCAHHKHYGRGVENGEPATVAEIAKAAGVDKGTVSRFFKKAFGGYSQYKVYCQREAVGLRLAVLMGDVPSLQELSGGFMELKREQ